MRLRRTLWLAGCVLACGLAASFARAETQTLTVFAAASTGTALSEIAELWEAETGIPVVLSLAGTSSLARQISAGAPADVFLSANEAWMTYLEDEGWLAEGSRRNLLGNTLVLVAQAGAAPLDLSQADSASDLSARLGTGRLAMALVDAVPAGIYGKAALQSLGLWEVVAPQVAQTDSVRAALALVAVGAAPLGVVYTSDARAEPRVTGIATFPDDSHPPIVYPVAALAEGNVDQASAFLDFLSAAPSRTAFERQGFSVYGD